MNKVLVVFRSLTAVLLLAAATSTAFAQQDYKTPQDAVDALVASAKTDDPKAALVVFRGAMARTSSLRATRFPTRRSGQRFVASYEAKRRIGDGWRQQGDAGDRRQRLPLPDPAGA